MAQLAVTQWSAMDLVGEDGCCTWHRRLFCPACLVQDVDDAAERRLPEFTTATQAEKFKEQEKSASWLEFYSSSGDWNGMLGGVSQLTVLKPKRTLAKGGSGSQ